MRQIRDALDHVVLGVIALTPIVAAGVSALRLAGDSEVMPRQLPPVTSPLSFRLAQLRRNGWRQVRRHAYVALWLATACAVGGAVLALSIRPLNLGAFVAALLFTAYLAVTWSIIAGIILLGRYLGAHRRVILESQVPHATTADALDT
jgi:hypothetical protein